MAGTQEIISIDYDSQPVADLLDQLLANTINTKPAMMEIAFFLEKRARDHFDEEQAPDGTPWATLTPETLARKRKKGVPVNQILHGEHLHLRDTIYPFHSIDMAGVSTGTDASAYAATHQFGDEERNIEARPYLGLSAEDEIEIIEIIKEHIGKKA